jgi:DNA (cytosine-5)-methyltransferase 1
MREIFSGQYWESEPGMGRVANGIPGRVDRLRALGNAVVPQQIYPILKAIGDIERGSINDH